MTVTFVIEVMASANAIVTWRQIQHRKRVSFSYYFSFIWIVFFECIGNLYSI